MLNQVRKTRRRAVPLLAATICSFLVVSGTAAAAASPWTGAEAEPDPGARSWSVDLAAVTDDDAGVRGSDDALRLDPSVHLAAAPSAESSAVSGQLVDAPVVLDSPASSVSADVDATTPHGSSVLVDVRGRLADQGPDSWTEWVPAGSELPSASRTVQVRVTLVGETDDGTVVSPVVQGVRLTPEPARVSSLQAEDGEAAEAGPTSGQDVYPVFATREGLVGGTTANGHVITKRDHFVALPSRRGLSAKGSGSYSVRVCAASTGRCAYAPVWDVGPWNTTDDYWNPQGTRQSWTDLPQGKAQAQAAYQDGYNGGRDGFDRRVKNPAGIDLADGTFWDGLGLTDNAWTTVTYLWTGSGPTGVIGTGGGPLTVRSGPGTGNAAVGQAGRYANVVIECTATGTSVTGPFGTSRVWDRIGPNNWVADAYVNTGKAGPVAQPC